MRSHWQKASGASGRGCEDDYQQLGIACVGGAKQIETMKLVVEGGRISLKKGIDRKKGIDQAFAVGEVVEELREPPDDEWLFDFDGWHRKCGVRVLWHTAPAEILDGCGKLTPLLDALQSG